MFEQLRNFKNNLISRTMFQLHLIFHEICLPEQRAGGHFGKWPPRPPGGSSAIAPPPNVLFIYWSTSVPKLVLLSKKYTIVLNIIGKRPHYVRCGRIFQMHLWCGVTAPHQPRLDYQMWFAARADYSRNHWLLNLVYRLLTGQNEGL